MYRLRHILTIAFSFGTTFQRLLGGGSGGGSGGSGGGSGGGGGGGGGGGSGGRSEYMGCLNYTTEELEEIWPFEGYPVNCSYVHHG